MHDEAMKSKWLLRDEGISRLDILRYFNMLTILSFPSDWRRMAPKAANTLFAPDCVPTVEDLVRTLRLRNEAEERRSLEEAFAQGTPAVIFMSKEEQQRRERAAVVIEAAYRGHKSRVQFERDMLDDLVVAKHGRVRRRTTLRAVLDREAIDRQTIVEQSSAFLVSRKGMEQFIREERIRVQAATRIQAVVRGWLWRSKRLPIAQEKALKKKLVKLWK